MTPRAPTPAGPLLSRRLVSSSLALALVSVLALGGLGCGGGGPSDSKNNISGKVTLNGTPVAGTIYFSAGGKEAQSAISPDGSYKVNDPPVGDADVTIKGFPGMSGAAGPTQPLKDGAKTGTMPGGGATAVPPPAKYATPGQLKHTVPAGKSEKNFELNP